MAAPSTVYLEDIQFARTPKDAKPTPTPSPPTTAVKRQRTLADMHFAPAPGVKRQKLDGASGSTLGSAARFTATKLSALQPLNAIPFSLSAFVDALPEDARALLALECDVMGKSWLKVLKDELTKPYFLALKKFLYAEGVRGAHDAPPARIYPAPKDIYAWSHTPLGRVKVVILGQDPYPGKGQAHGLSFSVPRGIAVPASLVNIYKELRTSYPDFRPPAHGHLAAWAAAGVLLLNAVLTVRAEQPDAHAGQGWEGFTDAVVRAVVRAVDRWGGASLPEKDGGKGSGLGRGVVFMAWGAKAAKRVAGLDGKKHLILKSAHPSPRSADSGFFGNGHFPAANTWLEGRYGKGAGVDWCAL